MSALDPKTKSLDDATPKLFENRIEPQEELLTFDQAATYLQISTKLLKQWVKHRIPGPFRQVPNNT